MTTNKNQKTEGETTPSETNFKGFDENYSFDLHQKMQKIGVNNDLELSLKIRPNDSVVPKTDSLIDDSHFRGNDPSPFEKRVEAPIVTLVEKIPAVKGVDYRDKNDLSIL